MLEAGAVCSCDVDGEGGLYEGGRNPQVTADNGTEISSEISCSDNAAEDIVAEDLCQSLEKSAPDLDIEQFLNPDAEQEVNKVPLCYFSWMAWSI